MDIKKYFGERVRGLRKQQGYSQEAFAAKCKIHRTHMGLIENGKTNVTLDNVAKIAEQLKISVEKIFRGI